MPIDRRISCRSRQLRAHRARLRRRHPNVRVRAGLAPAGGNRHGYAGYEFEPVTSYAFWHVRNRALNSDLGRWTIRDRLGAIDGPSFYAFVRSDPLVRLDPTGWMMVPVASTFLGINRVCPSAPAIVANYVFGVPQQKPPAAGWLVQEVEYKVSPIKCDGTRLAPVVYHFGRPN